MKRYFYSKHLAAAWMNLEFGMEFRLRDNFYDPDVWYKIEFGPGLGGYVRGDRSCSPLWSAEKLYIHPDSLRLLEPQSGDLVQWLIVDGKGGVIADAGSTGRYWQPGNIERIIERDRKAFHWPESEDA